MAARVSPTETIRAQIHELFASGGELLRVVEQVARRSGRLTFQSVVEELVGEELAVTATSAAPRTRRRLPQRLAAAAGGQDRARPGPRPASQAPPRSRRAVRAAVRAGRHPHQRAGDAGDRLLGAGLSDRDAAATLVEVFGEQATSSRATVGRICQRLRAEFDAWRRRDLSPATVEDRYPDGSFCKLHQGAKAEPVLVAWGIDVDGKPCFLGLAPGAAASTHAGGRCLTTWVTAAWPRRCWWSPTAARAWAPRPRPASRPACTSAAWSRGAATSSPRSPATPRTQVKRDSWAIFDGIDAEGEAAVAEARRRAKRFAAKWQRLYPSAVAGVADNLDQLVARLRVPAEHRKRVRHSDLIERTFRGDPPPGEGDRSAARGRRAACRWSGRSWTGRPGAGGACR